MIAALFVEANGTYYGLPNIDPWDKERDARRYQGPHHAIAHPPCNRWGAFWSGGTNPAAERRHMGDDGGCFAAALWAVRTFGGVIEHPANSHAWRWFGLPSPGLCGWWGPSDSFGGATCCVEQGNYGHAAPKSTWLYAVLREYPELLWGPSGATGRVENMSAKQRMATPELFRDTLIEMVSPSPGPRHR